MVIRCKSRLSKHVKRFVNELKNVHCQSRDRYKIPEFVVNSNQMKVHKDLERFRIRCRDNHDLYIRACIDRLNQLRDQSCKLICSSSNTISQQIMTLIYTTYEVR